MSIEWIVILVLAAIALAAILFLARNRKPATPADIGHTEAATHRLYEQEDAEDHDRENRVER